MRRAPPSKRSRCRGFAARGASGIALLVCGVQIAVDHFGRSHLPTLVKAPGTNSTRAGITNDDYAAPLAGALYFCFAALAIECVWRCASLALASEVAEFDSVASDDVTKSPAPTRSPVEPDYALLACRLVARTTVLAYAFLLSGAPSRDRALVGGFVGFVSSASVHLSSVAGEAPGEDVATFARRTAGALLTATLVASIVSGAAADFDAAADGPLAAVAVRNGVAIAAACVALDFVAQLVSTACASRRAGGIEAIEFAATTCVAAYALLGVFGR